jgi:hypothetical protein
MRGKLTRRDGVLVLALVGLMFLVVLFSAHQDADDNAPPALSSYSNESNGARALALWLETLGYPVQRLEGVSFGPDRDACLLLVLSPQQAFGSDELKRLDEWVTDGGTLFLAAEGWGSDSLLAHFELDSAYFDAQAQETGPAQPLLLEPPWSQARVRARRYLVTGRDDVVVLVAHEGHPVLLSFEHGAGQVFVTTTAYPFTNAGLRDAGNARLAHNLVTACPPKSLVVFDEFHHGYQTARTLTIWLRTTPQGRSLIYAALLVLVYLLAGGRRFGRPLPLPQALARRAPVEYIQAMANLFRRGGKRVAILHHYHDRLKRELAHAHRLDPTLADADFVAQLSTVRLDLNQAALLKLLQETNQGHVSEGDLIRLAKEVDAWIGKTG